MATLTDFEKRIHKLNDDFLLFTSKASPATPEIIKNYEREKSLTFSKEIKEFLLSYGSLILEVSEDIWKRPDKFDVLPAWEFGYGFFIYGLSSNKEMPHWLSFHEKYTESEINRTSHLGQMFFKRSGNLYRAYTNKKSIIIEYGKSNKEIKTFKGNLYDFLIMEIDKLEHDYEKYISR